MNHLQIDKMPSPPPKPSSPIPFQRNRAHTMDESWPPSHNPPQGSFRLRAIENISSLDPKPATEERTDPYFTANAANGPLHIVDTMLLQVVRDQNGNTLGMRVIDPNNTMGKEANICAPLPLGESTTGMAFNVGSAQAMHEAFMKAKQVTDSERIVGVMFAPVKQKGQVRDVDWSILEQGKKPEKETGPKAVKGHRSRHTTNEFGESSKQKPKPKAELENWSEDSDAAAGLQLHPMIRDMYNKGDK
ncbi:hypothetical protein FPOAC2_00151 [Fusarium poae]